MRPGAILSRFVVALALALFGVPQGNTERSAAQAGPAAERQINQAQGILTVQRHLLRAQLPCDDTPDIFERAVAVSAPPALAGVRLSAIESVNPPHATLRMHPPVRGPPAV